MADLTPEQHTAITYGLATAPDIQEDLKAMFNHGENMFFYNDLLEYRINNSLEDIAKDLDERTNWCYKVYSLTTDGVARASVGRAFRGYHDEEARKLADMINPETGVRYVVEAARKGGRKIADMTADMINPEYQFNGLFGKVTNDIISEEE